ncbi:hypothetical protein ACFXHA_12490 [Nocardia sp. NPDC059240]|uniref:nSTAND1 domain-containing NTPase n=1 Tax=Nocardia sp. NPDC059240 TaxID=3346786 RepID=UPI0036BDB6D6
MTDEREDRRGEELPRDVFAQQLTQLWVCAGNPTLQNVTEAANRMVRSTGGTSAKRLTLQRISDWRAGRNLPARFDAVRPVLFVLIEKSRHASGPTPKPLLDLNHWRQLWVSARSWTPDSDCPYRGLEPYRPENAGLFFGRDRATGELTALVRSTGAEGGGIVVLVGASGAGKSSLLAAGLIPGLGSDWQIVSGTPSSPPEGASLPEAGQRVLIVDQFEELFTTGLSEARQHEFLAELQREATSGAIVVLGLRADFFARCLEYPALAHALAHRSHVLGPMSEPELTEAITRPARSAGLKLEPGLVELIIAELIGLGGRHRGHDGSGALPLLSHVMATMWDRHDGNRLTVARYRAAGGVAGSVAKTAQDAWERLGLAERDAAKDMLLALVTVGRDTRDTRRYVVAAELLTRTTDPDAAVTALEQLARARLITIDADSTALTHEIVIDAWPVLRGWIEADRAGHLVRQRAETDAAEWISNGRSRALLYRGARLAQAREYRRGLPAAAGEFLSAALRARRRRTWAQAGLAATLVVLLVATLTGYFNTRIANAKKDAGFFATVLSDADRLQSSDPTLSAELDVLAQRLQPGSLDARSRLIGSQSLPLVSAFNDRANSATHDTLPILAYLDNDLLAVSRDDDRSIDLWNTTKPSAVVAAAPAITDHSDVVTALIAHGTLLISGSKDHTVRIRDVADPTRPRLIDVIDIGVPVVDLAISRDGHTLAIGDAHGADLFDLGNPVSPRRLPLRFPVDGELAALSFVSNGRTLLTSERAKPSSVTEMRTLLAWNTDPAQGIPHSTQLARSSDQRTFVGPTDNLVAIADNRTDSTTKVVDSDVRLLRIDDADHPVQVAAPFSVASVYYLIGLAFSPDGHTLATLTSFGTSFWNLSDPATPTKLATATLTGADTTCPRAPAGHRCKYVPQSLRFSPDGRLLTIAYEDGSVQQWSMPPAVLFGQSGQVRPTVSADGTRMLTTAPGADAHIWDVHDPAAVRLLGTITKPDFRMPGLAVAALPSISSDGRLAGLVIDGAMTLLDISNPAEPLPVHRFPDAVGMAFAVDRPLLATVSALPPSFRLWNVSDPNHPVPLGIPTYISISPSIGDTGLQEAASRDGKVVVVLSDKLMVWDALMEHPGPPVGTTAVDRTGDGAGLAVSPDHRTAVTAVDSGMALRWDISDPKNIAPLGDPLRVSENIVASLDISPDGRFLATGGTDSTVRLWTFTDPAHPQPYGRSLTPSDSMPWQVAFHPRAGYLFGGGDNGALRVWDLDPDHAVDRVCGLLGSRIDADLADHFPGAALPRVC